MTVNAHLFFDRCKKTCSNAPVTARPFFLLLAALTIAAPHAPARAQSIPAVMGSMVSIENVTDFKAQPLALLAKFPEAGTAMASYVARMFSREPGMIDSLLSIMDDTSPQQATAIGAGLVRSVRAIENKNPTTARMIANKISQSSNLWLKTTFSALGPHYSANALPSAPARLLPAPLSTATVGLPLGDFEARLGSRLRSGCGTVGRSLSVNDRLDPLSINRADALDPIVLDADGYGVYCAPDGSDKKQITARDTDPFSRGTIVAMVDSDARSNGAVSTSPTE